MAGRTFDQLIDFTRTTAGTYVDSTGKIVSTPASRNLLTFTQQFDNAAWTKLNAQAVPNQNPAAATLESELVTNGDFAGGTTGWSGNANTTLSVVSGALRVTAVADGLVYGTQAITTVPGRLYRVTATLVADAATGNTFVYVGSSAGNGDIANLNLGSTTGAYTRYFVATGTTAHISLSTSTGALAAEYVEFDNISVREVVGGWNVAPDGTSTADTLIATGTSTPAVSRNFASTAATYTLSVYLKQGNTAFSEIELVDQGTVANRVRLTYATGAVTVVSGSPTAAAANVGNGWWRVSLTYTFPAPGAADTVVVYPSTTTGAVNDYCLVWGAQLELGALTDYTRNNGGVFPARFDYDPVTLAPRGLLVEEQRVNLLTYSEQFDDAAWTKSDATVTANATTSPDGTVDADKLVETATTASHHVGQSATTTAATHGFSVFLKAAERSFALLWNQTANFGRVFNLSNGTVSGTVAGVTQATAEITNVGNGWYRCTIYGTCTAAANTFRVYTMTDATTFSYTGDGTSGIFLWGAQLEAGAFVTSYIPTVASQVTRAADVAAITGPNFTPWYNQSAGTFVVEGDSGVNVSLSIYVPVSANDGTANNRIQPFIYNGKWGGSVRVAGVDQADLQQNSSFTANVPAKIALAYAVNDFAVSVNGNTALTDTSGSLPTVNQLAIGQVINSNFLNGHIRSIRYYPSRLSNAQLQALTA